MFTLSNDATGNAIFAYDRATDGSLTPQDVYFTGGIGTSSGLGNQGALAYSPSHKLMFAVNAGDGSVSTFVVHSDRTLMLLSKVASGGVRPVSVTTAGDLVYVLNAGGGGTAGNIAGFRIYPAGLGAISSSTRPLSADTTAPAQISFTLDGKVLVVTEKATNVIDTYVVDVDGRAGAPNVQASVGATPFGFAFGANGHLIVSEAFGGTANASAVSSYAISPSTGALTPVSSSVTTSQSAACWVVVRGSDAYVANTGSANLSSFSVGPSGAITLDGNGSSAPTGTGPTDMAITTGGEFLYVLDSGDDALSSYAIDASGALTAKPAYLGMPERATGLVAL